MDTQQPHDQASKNVAGDLRTIAQSETVRTLSQLTLPEIEAVVDQIERMVPAGNIPALILSGLLRLPSRKLTPDTIKKDIDLLYRGFEQTRDTAIYTAFFAGPAAVLWAYQSLLKLAGLAHEQAFTQGLWQFYVYYAMRDDTARHTCETHGFDSFLKEHQIHLNRTDRMTAWVMAAIDCLHQYNALLANEWRERVYTQLVVEVTQNELNPYPYTQLYRQWESQRPYGLGPDAKADEIYPLYRRRKFDEFLARATADLPPNLYNLWEAQVHLAENDLPAYQEQMSILSYLNPGRYEETAVPIDLDQAHIGLIYRGRYSLIPVCVPNTDYPIDVQGVRAEIAALQAGSANQHAGSLVPLARLKRAAWPDLNHKLSKPLLRELDMLRQAPILLNFDAQPHHLPLSTLRQAERGLGGHALTLFDTGETMVFDQSHLFFDGVWSVALAEIITQTAITWARHLTRLTEPSCADPHYAKLLSPTFLPADLALIEQAPDVPPEVSAETNIVDLKSILNLRQRLKQRHERIHLTVNDLLILYRAIHATTYQPDPDLVSELTDLTDANTTRQAALTALEAIDPAQQLNPTIVMPVDASRRSPRDRLFPITFEVPLHELDILDLHERTITALTAYKHTAGDQSQAYTEFDQLRRLYLGTLAGFGAWFDKAKKIAGAGESFSVSTMKLLAPIPPSLQHLLERIPNSLDLLNDLIRGRENISNVGAVVPGSTLTRFMSAKDDNEQKTLIWGVISDAQGVMHITLRDFRPHVGLLIACGCQDLATRLTQHYLKTYAHGLNEYIDDLLMITKTSRKPHLRTPERSHG